MKAQCLVIETGNERYPVGANTPHGLFYFTRDDACRVRVGDAVVVAYEPDDQFAYLDHGPTRIATADRPDGKCAICGRDVQHGERIAHVVDDDVMTHVDCISIAVRSHRALSSLREPVTDAITFFEMCVDANDKDDEAAALAERLQKAIDEATS